MKNYISICGQKIEITDEQVEQIKDSLGKTIYPMGIATILENQWTGT